MIEPKTHTIEQPGALREEVAHALEQTINCRFPAPPQRAEVSE